MTMRTHLDEDPGDWAIVVQFPAGCPIKPTAFGTRDEMSREAEWLMTLPEVRSVAVVERSTLERVQEAMAR